MAGDQAIPEAIREQAKALGLERLTDADLRQFMKAAQVAQSRRAALDTRSLVASDEPAHVYRLR
jgi:hypothetical protein